MNEAKKVLEQAIERWNANDREGWAVLYTDDVVYEAPGGTRIAGLTDLKQKYFDALLTATPDRASRGSIRIYYDQIEVFTQLGLVPGATAS